MSNIKILARIKPSFKNTPNCIITNENEVHLSKHQKRYKQEHLVNYKYKFDKVFDDKSDNVDLYNNISIDILRNLLKWRKNVTFYVYGQTGSGKTHTILGNNKEHGFLTMILRDMIEISKQATISVMEIYSNQCFDLLNNNQLIMQKEDYNRDFVLRGVEKKVLTNKEDVAMIKDKISKCRKVGISSENDRSSRSHLLIHIEFSDRSLRILDLAGCEKAKTSICENRKAYMENGGINQSLFALKECIRALLQKKSHIPYRRCELTKVLRQAFNTDSKTYILSTISQERYNAGTSMDVLTYVANMKNIKKVEENILPDINMNCQNVVGSPRYKFFYSNKDLISNLNSMENNIMDQIFKKKSTQYLFEDYAKIIDRKNTILQTYIHSAIPKPPSRPIDKNIKPSPRVKKYIENKEDK